MDRHEGLKSYLLTVIAAAAGQPVDLEVCSIPAEELLGALTDGLVPVELLEVAAKVGAALAPAKGRVISAKQLADAIESVGAATPLCPVIVERLRRVA